MKKEIAYFMRRLYRQKLSTTSGGNISARENGFIYITPSEVDKGEMKTEQVGKVDLEGNIIESSHKLSIETAMHLAIYKARPDIKAIVHAHPPYATSYASSNKKLNSALTSEGRLILGNIAYADYALMGTDDLAKVVAKASIDSNVILMENHGVIALGKSLLKAFDRLEVLEFTAKMNFITETLNMRVPLTKEQLTEIDKLSQ